MLIWLHKEPKMYQGGDFEIVNSNTVIESKNNRMVLFPSFYYHKVHKLTMDNSNEENFGRYTITHFLYHTLYFVKQVHDFQKALQLIHFYKLDNIFSFTKFGVNIIISLINKRYTN
jgi:hypothetical protein